MRARSLSHLRWAVAFGAVPGCAELPRTPKPETCAALARTEVFTPHTLANRWTDGAMSASSPTPIPAAMIRNGRLRLEGRRNHPLWLNAPLWREFAIDFDAWPLSAQGDIKVELAGDPRSLPGNGPYKPSGYVLIFGGWNGSMHMIARKDEHGTEQVSRLAAGIDAGRRYHFRIERRESSIRWFVDGRLLLRMTDERPLHGPHARSLGLSGWTAPVEIGALRISPLPCP